MSPVKALSEQGVFIVGDLCIDTIAHQVRLGQKELNLTLTEYDLLLFFVRKKGEVITRSQLMKQTWGKKQPDSDHPVNVHICRLRKKLERDPGHPTRLVLVRGVGYRLTDE